jgi:hypothetical protein
MCSILSRAFFNVFNLSGYIPIKNLEAAASRFLRNFLLSDKEISLKFIVSVINLK